MKVGKPISKRTPVRLRHKIQKASAAKQRKQRKEAKKNPQWRSRLKKDPGIPNLFPYKAKLLAEIEEGKRRKAEEVEKRREVARAQRMGAEVADAAAADDDGVPADDDGGELLDDDDGDDDEMDESDDGGGNPMAALLASAQARAQAFTRGPGDDEDYDDEDSGDADGDGDGEFASWEGIEEGNRGPAPGQAVRNKDLPKQAIADPVKASSALLDRMQKTEDGVQRLLDFYSIPPLVTTGSDLTSRFLVEVARKKGRLGKGGIPNLHSAALTVLSDLNDGRLQLPAVEVQSTTSKTEGISKGGVQVVTQMAQPFQIEGLFGGDQEPV